jgi:hypothetical protein
MQINRGMKERDECEPTDSNDKQAFSKRHCHFRAQPKLCASIAKY